MVVDTSALLSLILEEPTHSKVLSCISQAQKDLHSESLFMSTVNLTETIIILLDRTKSDISSVKKIIDFYPITFIEPTEEDSYVAALARKKYPLNLGDCFAYCLAKKMNLPLITLDSDFKGSDIHAIIPA